MNTSIETMLSRRSVRSFELNKTIPEEVLNTILKVGQQSPNSANGQQYSVIVVENQNIKDQLVEITAPSSGNKMTYISKAPIFLLFVIDYNKIEKAIAMEGQEMIASENLESLLVGSVDVGISISAMSAAAESLGLGTVVVGAIRKDTTKIIDLFKLPKYTFPIAGMAIGYPSEKASTQITPRLSMETFAHRNVYKLDNFEKHLADYHQTMKEFYATRGIQDLTWSKFICKYYTKELYTDIAEVYQKQGLGLK